MTRRVLLVCLGNICRSPTAEGVVRAIAAREFPGLDLHVDSAGTANYHAGEPPDRRSIAAARRRGYELAALRARQVTAYAISAALAGVAGAVFVQATGYVNLAVLGLERAAGVLIILILGGHGRLYGAFAGALVYMVLEHALAKAYPTAWQLGLGLTLVAVSLFARNGVIGMFDSLRRRLAGPAG